MGFMDSILGESPSVDWHRTGQQKRLGGAATNLLMQLFGQGGWQNLLPTGEMMKSLSPEVWAGANYPIEQGANALQERLMGSGMMGGSGGSALANYYANAQPQVYGQLANMVSGAAQYPYAMAGSLWGQTQPTPIVSQGNPGMMSSMFQMAAPWAMSFMPWGNFGGLAGGQ